MMGADLRVLTLSAVLGGASPRPSDRPHLPLFPPPQKTTYAYTTTISQAAAPVFSQDIGALSHEIGECILDPFTTNNSPCGIMENGDPLETEPNFGDFPYTVNGFTYHPQDLPYRIRDKRG